MKCSNCGSEGCHDSQHDMVVCIRNLKARIESLESELKRIHDSGLCPNVLPPPIKYAGEAYSTALGGKGIYD